MRVMGKQVGGADIFPPHDVIGRVDLAVVVVIAIETNDHRAQAEEHHVSVGPSTGGDRCHFAGIPIPIEGNDTIIADSPVILRATERGTAAEGPVGRNLNAAEWPVLKMLKCSQVASYGYTVTRWRLVLVRALPFAPYTSVEPTARDSNCSVNAIEALELGLRKVSTSAVLGSRERESHDFFHDSSFSVGAFRPTSPEFLRAGPVHGSTSDRADHASQSAAIFFATSG